jgi:hypothetical protein
MHPPIDLQSEEKRWLLAVLPLTTYPGMRYAYQKYSFVGERKSSCASCMGETCLDLAIRSPSTKMFDLVHGLTSSFHHLKWSVRPSFAMHQHKNFKYEKLNRSVY